MGVLSSVVTTDITPDSLMRLIKMADCTPIFLAAYTGAMNICVNVVQTRAKTNAATGFKHPTGRLLGGITGIVHNPYLGEVGVGRQVPYARRRELGFSGMTDSLGRTYKNDPGIFYLHRALEASRPDILAAYLGAAETAIRAIIS